ncbi:PREDICTED: coagulation factor XIII B chain isoform X1 [Gavialis gangeticus]|uniref:coagulation factor XIII B chain isoform X1 n=1 Tax=Gavialis gangeticus TaxID=94835 RepID=UPI00092FA110|nr:PREDICTED: coagulation factor XIII B chain isoform X1 [Gavialis gangeticus]
MGVKNWVFLLILVDTGKLFAEDEDKPCDLPHIENGKIGQYYYSFKSFYFPMSKNKKLSYACLAGYTTGSGSQDAKITCTAEGWSPAPKCYKKCNKPPLENGFFSGTKESFKIGEKLQYRCDSGYHTPGGNTEETIQCHPEGWSSQPACAKMFDRCLAPDLQYGRHITTQRLFKLNEILIYECDDGYRTTGGNMTEEVTCHPHGWSLTPNCTKLTCSLSVMEHGRFYPVKKTYEEGDVVQFFCRESYSFSGSDLIQCYSFGWYPEPPLCEDRRTKCPPPPKPPHAIVLSDLRTYHNGDRVRLQCQLNFKMNGSEEIQCQNGKWLLPPVCIGIQEEAACDQPPSVEKGTAITEDKTYYSGDTVRYRCDPGYRINGLKEIICEMGKWTSPPECIKMQENCTSPPLIQNGAVVGPLLTKYTTGSSVQYRCQRYHVLEGFETIHCVEGNWTPQPACLEPCTINEHVLNNNNILLKWGLEGELIFLHGDIIEFLCKQGYELSQSTGTSPLTAHCNRGKINYPICIMEEPKEKCGFPPIIKNGGFVDSPLTEYDSGSSVEYNCSSFHFLNGSKRIYCSEGQWTTPPICFEPCTLSHNIMDKNNLILRWSFDNRLHYIHGEYVEFHCKENHLQAPSTSMSDFRVQCNRGQLAYPRCIEIER